MCSRQSAESDGWPKRQQGHKTEEADTQGQGHPPAGPKALQFQAFGQEIAERRTNGPRTQGAEIRPSWGGCSLTPAFTWDLHGSIQSFDLCVVAPLSGVIVIIIIFF